MGKATMEATEGDVTSNDAMLCCGSMAAAIYVIVFIVWHFSIGRWCHLPSLTLSRGKYATRATEGGGTSIDCLSLTLLLGKSAARATERSDTAGRNLSETNHCINKFHCTTLVAKLPYHEPRYLSTLPALIWYVLWLASYSLRKSYRLRRLGI